jgi:hypothetical protein
MVKDRQFIRHPSEIPIEAKRSYKLAYNLLHLHNISLGGLAFKSAIAWTPGTVISIRVPLIDPNFETFGKVVWCKKQQEDTNFDVGVEFMQANDAFRARMVEQVCQIEQYKRRLEQQGRKVSIDEAAMEWINRYAADFPPLQNGNSSV